MESKKDLMKLERHFTCNEEPKITVSWKCMDMLNQLLRIIMEEDTVGKMMILGFGGLCLRREGIHLKRPNRELDWKIRAADRDIFRIGRDSVADDQ